MNLKENVLIERTIEKLGYDPRLIKGRANYNKKVVCLCIECNEEYEIRFESCVYGIIKPCGKCSNRRNGKNNVEKISKTLKEKYANGTLIHGMLGRTHTDEVKEILRNNKLNKSWVELYGEDRATIMKKEKSDWMIENNPYRGKHHSQEVIEKIKAKLKNKIRKGNKSNFYGKKYWPKTGSFIYNDKKFRSRWEIKVVKYFEENNIEWIYEPKHFIIDENRTYLPDFYLPATDSWVEVKGYFGKIGQDKFYDFQIKYPEIKIEL